MLFKKLLHILGRAFISLFFGVEKVPKIQDEQCIIAANHNSHVDIMILFRLFEISRIDKIRTIAAKGYFAKGFKGYIAKIFFNTVLVDRSSSSRKTFEVLKKEIQRGNSLIIFPEGTRGQPGVINTFKSGIGEISIDFPDVPIYPVCLSGAEKTLPKGTCIPVPFNIKIKILAPVYGRDHLSANRKESRKKITSEIENRIRNK
jgi:1-acyl-sn-glycerol-3-phosphate acyltransferase